jgi:hypothetical protein
MTADHRVTPGLTHEVLDALEPHGYDRSDDLHADRAIGLIGDLAGIYEGTQDHPAYPGPAPHDAITLTHADAITIFAASDIAAGDKRYRARMCPDCADQSCPACQVHIRDGEAFDQMADRMLQAAQATPAASEPAPDRWSQPAADREAGQ